MIDFDREHKKIMFMPGPGESANAALDDIYDVLADVVEALHGLKHRIDHIQLKVEPPQPEIDEDCGLLDEWEMRNE